MILSKDQQRQAIIHAKCAHPTGQWEEFKPEEVEQSIISRFEQMVARYPQRPAVKAGSQTITYDELNAAANRLGHFILQTQGPQSEPVLFLLPLETSSIIAILGILKTGKFYVALDVNYPIERLRQIIEDSGARLLITNQAHQTLAMQLASPSLRVFNLDDLPHNTPTHNPLVTISPEAYAYLIYTSGSTGNPKGVIETHIDVIHFSRILINWHQVCAEDHIGLSESHSFRGAAAKTYPALLSGALLCLFDSNHMSIEALIAWICESQITYWLVTPSIFRQFVQHRSLNVNHLCLRVIGLGGDRVTPSDWDLVQKYLPRPIIVRVGYALSEVKQVSFYFFDREVRPSSSVFPVGYCVEETEVMIVDEGGYALRPSEIGEIVIKTKYMSPGYWRQPDLTARVFKADPDNPQIRWYFTGDMGMMSPDGCLYHMGRKDHQVKIRGVRVETAEIEQALYQTDWFKEVVVAAKPDATGELQLVAYLVAKVNPPPNITTLRHVLSVRLPSAMLPSAFVFLAALPLNINNKVDIRALPQPSADRPQLAVAYIAPRYEIERQLTDIWQAVLGVAPIGVDDHFLDLGGNSLRAMQVISRVSQQLQTQVSLLVLLTQPTIAAMALVIMNAQVVQIDQTVLAKMIDEIEGM